MRSTSRTRCAASPAALNEKAEIEAGLRVALVNDSFALHYQPMIDQQRQVTSVEALLRWDMPGRGLVPPARFIPIAEESNLILQIGQWVLQRGYASLTYLKRLPVDQLKIDQSFINGIESDPSDAAIVRTIISMSRTLQMEVVAEGVEKDAQHAFLKEHRCNLFQGYLFGKPMPLMEFESLVAGMGTCRVEG